jgi:hypothetical protein
MLNNEKAALATARKFYKDLKKRNASEFIDPDFGPKDDKDENGHKFALYKDGKVPQKGYPEPSECKWVFAEALCDPGEKV